MTGLSLGDVDLGKILFTFQNIDEFPEVWVICSYIGLETAACVLSFVSLIIWSSKTCNLALHANLFLCWSHSQQTAPFSSTFCFTHM